MPNTADASPIRYRGELKTGLEIVPIFGGAAYTLEQLSS